MIELTHWRTEIVDNRESFKVPACARYQDRHLNAWTKETAAAMMPELLAVLEKFKGGRIHFIAKWQNKTAIPRVCKFFLLIWSSHARSFSEEDFSRPYLVFVKSGNNTYKVYEQNHAHYRPPSWHDELRITSLFNILKVFDSNEK